VPFTSSQVKDLDPNSEFLRALSVAWGQAQADKYVLTRHVEAADDAIVGKVSAMGQWSPGYEVIGGVGHIAIAKPESVEDTSFIIAKNFLLEESLLPGGVEADYRAPLLRLNYLEAKESTRFIYAARVLPFIGRDAEINKLAEFLGHPKQPFRWMVLHGSAGVGKSRLALELCLALRNEWHAGFLPHDGDEPDWGRWQPLIPTLIVVDYAARDAPGTAKILRALSGRGAPDGTSRLLAPVRVLLIERAGAGDWLDKVVGSGLEKARVEDCHMSKDLQLITLSDPWPIFEFVLRNAKKALPEKAETLGSLERIDPERRPLFAYFMADAIAAGRDIRHFDTSHLLDDVIKRNREKFWKPAGATTNEERLLAKDERLLTLATMTRGLPVSTVKTETENFVRHNLLPAWDVYRHPAMFLAMTARESGEMIAPLEPDIVGENFALSCLAQNNLSNDDRTRFCALAWRINPVGMAQFMLHCHFDLPGHVVLPFLRKLPPDPQGTPQFAWGWASTVLINHLGSHDPETARVFLGEMLALAQERDEAFLWAQWARAAMALIAALSSRDYKSARHLLDLMRRVADKRGESILVRLRAGAAAVLVINHSRHDHEGAEALLNELRAQAQERGEPHLSDLLHPSLLLSLGFGLSDVDSSSFRAFISALNLNEFFVRPPSLGNG
jgi:hypothetical protein